MKLGNLSHDLWNNDSSRAPIARNAANQQQLLQPSNALRRATRALALLLAAGTACGTSFAQTITTTSALPAAEPEVIISGTTGFEDPPGTITSEYSFGSLQESGVLANGASASTAATLNQFGASAQVTNAGLAAASTNYYLIVTGPGAPGSTVQLALSNALLSTSGVDTSLTYGADYRLYANLNIVQATPADTYAPIVGGTAPINGSLNLNGTYTVTLGEPIYVQEAAWAQYAYNGSSDVTWSASVDPVISLSSSVANPSAYTFAYSEGAPIGGGGIVAAPEIDPRSAASGLALLLGGLEILRGRRAIRWDGAAISK